MVCLRQAVILRFVLASWKTLCVHFIRLRSLCHCKMNTGPTNQPTNSHPASQHRKIQNFLWRYCSMGRLFISLTWCFWLFLNFEEVSGISGRLSDMVSVRNFVFGNRFIAITHMKDIWHDAGDVEEMTLGAAFPIYFKLSRQMHTAYGNIATRVEWKILEMAKRKLQIWTSKSGDYGAKWLFFANMCKMWFV